MLLIEPGEEITATPADWPSNKDRRRIATMAADIMDATDENLLYALRKLPKSRRQALRRSLA